MSITFNGHLCIDIVHDIFFIVYRKDDVTVDHVDDDVDHADDDVDHVDDDVDHVDDDIDHVDDDDDNVDDVDDDGDNDDGDNDDDEIVRPTLCITPSNCLHVFYIGEAEY